MQEYIISDELIRSIIPNIQKTVIGETSWADRLSTFIIDAVRFVSDFIAPVERIKEIGLNNLLDQLVVWRAWSNAFNVIDLVATPNGFAVVSNQTLAPASKQRTEAARQEAVRIANEKACELVRSLFKYEKWRSSMHSERFRSIFPDPELFAKTLYPQGTDRIFDLYIRKHYMLTRAQSFMTVELFSKAGMDRLVEIAVDMISGADIGLFDKTDLLLLSLARTASSYLMADECQGREIKKIYTHIRSVMDTAESSEVAAAWKSSELYRAYKNRGYENTKESGGFFF